MFVDYDLTLWEGMPGGAKIPFNGNGKFAYSARWLASFTDDGVNLELDGKQPKLFTTKKLQGKEWDVSVDFKLDQSKEKDKKPFVRVDVECKIAYEFAGFTVSGYGVSGPPIMARKDKAESEGRLQLNLEFINRPAGSRPTPKIPRDLTKTKAYFEKINEDKLPSASLRTLDTWTNKIEKFEELHHVIEMGSLVIYLEGNTSRSGSKLYNADLAKRRIESVVRKLNSNFGSPRVSYSKKPKAQSEYEEQNDYRVDVFFKKEEAEKAIGLVYGN
jgi:outer membrane protein OmpA-like peptidoglycan-associated protein